MASPPLYALVLSNDPDNLVEYEYDEDDLIDELKNIDKEIKKFVLVYVYRINSACRDRLALGRITNIPRRCVNQTGPLFGAPDKIAERLKLNPKYLREINDGTSIIRDIASEDWSGKIIHNYLLVAY